MSFYRQEEIYQSDEGNSSGSDPRAAPRLIVRMSLQSAIPQPVALQQKLALSLHQPSVILKETKEV